MWKKPEKSVAIDPTQVTPGLYVWLGMPWDDHPFIYNCFKISDAKQIASLRAIKSKGKLYYYPDKSSAASRPGKVEGLKIEESLRPASIPPDVLQWLNPRQRLPYFFSTEKSN